MFNLIYQGSLADCTCGYNIFNGRRKRSSSNSWDNPPGCESFCLSTGWKVMSLFLKKKNPLILSFLLLCGTSKNVNTFSEFQFPFLSKELEPATVAPMCWRWKDPNRLMKSQKELRHWSIRGIEIVPFSKSDKYSQGANYKNHQLETSDGEDRGQEHGRRGQGWI